MEALSIISSEYSGSKLDIVEPSEIAYEIDSSNSTTSTNSPVISNHHLELPLCSCNELINSEYCCADCGEATFEPLKEYQIQHDKTKSELEELLLQKDTIIQKGYELETMLDTLKKTIKDKKSEIEQTSNGIVSLQHDLKVLEVKCKEETSQVKIIQQSTENVKKELEELTQRLFEEVNSMISVEKAEQDILQQKNNQLESDLRAARLELEQVENQLSVIKSQINDNDNNNEEEQVHNTSSDHSVQQNGDLMDRAQLEIMMMHGLDLGLYLDTLEDDKALMEFNDFIQLCQKTSLRNLHTLKYMKYCLHDDIAPCLRFGPNPKLSSKKIIDAILVKTCFVEECPENFVTEQADRQLKEEATATLWERFTSSSVFLGCQACGRNIKDPKSRPEELKYRFRISYFDEWACIDRYCRDRLLAVIEFYNFIRHLRSGHYKHRSLHELYQQSIQLRLQMFIAR